MADWKAISTQINEACGESLDSQSPLPVGGGCINDAYRLKTNTREIFIKINSASKHAMFEAEAEGLTDLAKSHTIHVPKPICSGIAGNDSFLAMEHLQLGGAANGAQLGQNIAAMHQATNNQPRYGWHRDNTIGSTPQINTYEDSWTTFWSKHRLGYQLALAKRKGANMHVLAQGEKLREKLTGFFSGYTPKASLLHGDLWSGNYAFEQSGHPVIFDPAVYYGDRETDLAMTELFGGFPADFYSAYNEAYPLDEGYPARKNLYNLYHILNHYNLFGGGYLSQANNMIDRLLSDLR